MIISEICGVYTFKQRMDYFVRTLNSYLYISRRVSRVPFKESSVSIICLLYVGCFSHFQTLKGLFSWKNRYSVHRTHVLIGWKPRKRTRVLLLAKRKPFLQ